MTWRKERRMSHSRTPHVAAYDRPLVNPSAPHMPPVDRLLAERRLALLQRLAWLCAVTVLAVISLSAYIRLTKAGLGCEPWPACYGQSLRENRQGAVPSTEEQSATAAARLAHRFAASLALLLVLTMLAVCFASRPVMRGEGLLALALLALAIFLAVLGRWSSGARVPAVAMGNLLGGMLMVALCVRLALVGHLRVALRPWALAAGLLLLMQIALGGLVSASYAGLSCTGTSGCGLVEAWQSVGPAGLDPWREPMLDAAQPTHPAGALAHSLHRHVGMLLATLLVLLSALAWRRGRRSTATVLLLLVATQVTVGAVLAPLALPLAQALWHNLLATALLATVATLT